MDRFKRVRVLGSAIGLARAGVITKDMSQDQIADAIVADIYDGKPGFDIDKWLELINALMPLILMLIELFG